MADSPRSSFRIRMATCLRSRAGTRKTLLYILNAVALQNAVSCSECDVVSDSPRERVWLADNPETLKGHEGHYVPAETYVYPDKNLIRITEVKIGYTTRSRNVTRIRRPAYGLRAWTFSARPVA